MAESNNSSDAQNSNLEDQKAKLNKEIAEAKHITLLLGAGASVCAGLPVGGELFKDLKLALGENGAEKYEEIKYFDDIYHEFNSNKDFLNDILKPMIWVNNSEATEFCDLTISDYTTRIRAEYKHPCVKKFSDKVQEIFNQALKGESYPELIKGEKLSTYVLIIVKAFLEICYGNVGKKGSENQNIFLEIKDSLMEYAKDEVIWDNLCKEIQPNIKSIEKDLENWEELHDKIKKDIKIDECGDIESYISKIIDIKSYYEAKGLNEKKDYIEYFYNLLKKSIINAVRLNKRLFEQKLYEELKEAVTNSEYQPTFFYNLDDKDALKKNLNHEYNMEIFLTTLLKRDIHNGLNNADLRSWVNYGCNTGKIIRCIFIKNRFEIEKCINNVKTTNKKLPGYVFENLYKLMFQYQINEEIKTNLIYEEIKTNLINEEIKIILTEKITKVVNNLIKEFKVNSKIIEKIKDIITNNLQCPKLFKDFVKELEDEGSSRYFKNLLLKKSHKQDYIDIVDKVMPLNRLLHDIKDDKNLKDDYELIQQSRDQLKSHKALLTKLLKTRQSEKNGRLHIFTTNYDSLIEDAANSNGTMVVDGFSYGSERIFDANYLDYDVVDNFDETKINNMLYLYKLHGSVNWKKEAEEVIALPGASDDPVLIVPGKTKFQSSYQKPYLEMISKFKERLVKSELLIIIGYAFGDEHINNIIEGVSRRNNGLKILICKTGDENLEINKNPTSLHKCLENYQDNRITLIKQKDVFRKFAEEILS